MAEAAAAVAEEAPAATSLAGEATAAKAAEKPKDDLRPEDTTVEHRADPEAGKADPVDAEPAERPEHIPEKFWKDGEVDTESLAKSYTELESKFRSDKHKAPKDGKYDGKFMDEKIPDDDAMLGKFNELAIKAGFSQDIYEKVIGLVIQNSSDVAQETTFDLDKEKKILGPQAQEIIDAQCDFADKLTESGYLSKDDREEFDVMAGTAAGVRVFMNMRRYYGDTMTIPVAPGSDAEPLPSKEECFQMVKSPEYKTNPAYRAKVEKVFAQVFGTDPDNHVRF